MPPPSDVYRHQARRLRQQYAGQPQALQYSLRELSRRYDRIYQSSADTPKVPAESKASDNLDLVGQTFLSARSIPQVTAIPVDPSGGPKFPGKSRDKGGAGILACLEVSRIRADKNVCPTKSTLSQRLHSAGNLAAPDPSANRSFARAVVDWFAEQVAGQLSGNLLHHSRRRELLKTADRLGIARFHANLIIAVAQHDAEAKTNRKILLPTSRRFPLKVASLIAILQILILWGAYRIVHFS